MSEGEYKNIKKNFGSVEVLKDINLNIGNQKFEIQNKNTKEIVELNLDETAKVLLSGRTYSTHSLNINGSRIIALLDECNIDGDFKLYYYAKITKRVKKTIDIIFLIFIFIP